MIFIKLASILALLSTPSHATSVKVNAEHEDKGAPKLLRGNLYDIAIASDVEQGVDDVSAPSWRILIFKTTVRPLILTHTNFSYTCLSISRRNFMSLMIMEMKISPSGMEIGARGNLGGALRSVDCMRVVLSSAPRTTKVVDQMTLPQMD